MPLGAQLRLRVGAGSVALRPCAPLRLRLQRTTALMVHASAEGSGADQNEGPREISLVRRVPGAGATFMLAGALKILTVGWIATGAPQGCVRTVAGQYAQFLLLPVGLLLCFIAKKIVDAGLHESRRFMAFVLGITAFLYFGLYSVLYRYEPKSWYAQQRLIAAAAQQRTSPYADEPNRRNKFIIQRQLEGEYDAHTAAYYTRAPEMQMEAAEAAVDTLPAGMVGGARGGARGRGGPAAAGAAEDEGVLGVGSSVAERRAGLAPGARGRGAPRVVPSMYESSSRMPELDDSEF